MIHWYDERMRLCREPDAQRADALTLAIDAEDFEDAIAVLEIDHELDGLACAACVDRARARVREIRAASIALFRIPRAAWPSA